MSDPRDIDTLTILTMRGDLLAAKRITRDANGAISKSEYSHAKHFGMRRHHVADIRAIHALLIQLSGRNQDCIVRGVPIPDAAPPGKWRKTIYPNDDGPACFRFADPGLRPIAFDFDDMKLDFYVSSPPTQDELRRAADLARSRLPSGFHRAACVYRFSASAGLDGWQVASLHLWFMLSRPVACRSIRAWSKGRMDGSVYGAVQPIYTADPSFIGMDDPLEGLRLGMLDGMPEAEPPADWLDFPGLLAKLADEAETFERARPNPITVGEHDAPGRRRWCLKALESACEEIQAQTKGSRHPTAVSCAFAIGGLVQHGGLERGEAEAALIAAIQSVVPRERHAKEADSVRELLALGMDKPRDLSRIGRGRPAVASAGPASEGTAGPDSAAPLSPHVEMANILGIRSAASAAEHDAMRRLCSGLDAVVDVDDALYSAPVDGHRIPYGYWMHNKATGSWKPNPKAPEDIKTFTVAHAPVVVSAKLKDLETSATTLQVAWRSPKGAWAHAALPKELAAQASKVVALAGADFPVTSGSAGFLAKYLDDYQAANYQQIRMLETTGVFGWVRGGARGFVWGKTHIQPDGRRIEIDVDDQATWPDGGVAFRSPEGGADAQLGRALHSAGSFERWREAARALYEHPRALIGIVVSLSGLMLEVLDAGNFVLDWGSGTGGGKTTSARFAMSVWGDPKTLEIGWNATEVAIEQSLSMRGCIPLWLDDTKKLTDKTLPSKVIYLVANGRGKARGGKSGNAMAVTDFRTVLLSTGEQPLTSFDESGGTRVRTLEVEAKPVAPGNADLVRMTSAIARANYGHAGPRAAAWLIERRSEWSRWRQEWRDRVAVLTSQVKTDHEGRVCETRALLEMTHELLCEQALRIGIQNPVDEVWDEITAEAATASGSERALSRVAAMFATEAYRFKGTQASLANLAGTKLDWMGNASLTDGGTVAFVKEKLSDEMKRWGFAPDTIYREWKAKGLTKSEGDRLTMRREINGATLACIVFPLESLGASAGMLATGAPPESPAPRGTDRGTVPQRFASQSEIFHGGPP